MKLSLIKKLLHSNSILKINAFIIGIGLWTFLSAHHKTSLTLKVPLCFYNTQENEHINGPEELSITCSATRTALRTLIAEPPVILIDAQSLHRPTTQLHITDKELYLSPGIIMVHYQPVTLLITQATTNV